MRRLPGRRLWGGPPGAARAGARPRHRPEGRRPGSRGRLRQAAGVPVISFIFLALFWPTPKLEGDSWRPIGKGDPNGAQPAFWQVIDAFSGSWAWASLPVLILWAGLDGVQSPAANIAPTFVYVIFWNGLVAAASCSATSSGRSTRGAAARAVAWVASKAAAAPMPEPMPYPERLGRGPRRLASRPSP